MTRRTIAYQPALDGVRAFAVTAVLLFHAGFGWMSGGYLGVSVFFTLSGFLITSLLLTEHRNSGSVDAKAFFTRRARRLLPASLVCLAAVCVLAAFGAWDGITKLRRDVLGALLQVFNWVKLASGESYADLTAAQAGLRRPLDHYWSLSIEEQFYWCWPLAFLAIIWWTHRRGWSPTRVVLALVVVSSAAAPLIAQVWGPDAAYWATPARIAEILFGALVACVVADRPVPDRAAVLAPFGMVTLTVACVLFPDGRGLAYHGALPLVGAVSALTIYGLQVRGPVRELLSWKPFVALGKVSYGVYLYHWPVYVLIDRQAWDMPAVADLALKWAVTLAITLLSYRLVELPVRHSTWLVPRRTLVASLSGTAVVAAMVLLVPATAKFYGVDSGQADAAAIDTASVAPLVTDPPTVPQTTVAATVPAGTTTSTLPASTTTTAVVPPRPVRIVVVGDSTAEATGAGVVAWAAANPSLAQVEIVAGAGCGLFLDGYQNLAFGFRDVRQTCGPYVDDVVPKKIAELKPDLVMVITTVWDVLDRSLEKGASEVSPTDAAVGTAMAASLSQFTDSLIALGVPRVAWVKEPVPLPTPTAAVDQQADPARHDVLHRVIDDIAAARPQVRVVDLATWVDATPLATDTGARPDAVHWTTDVSTQIAEQFLGQALLRAALQ
ncbi:MAG: acyltransferase family protein [Ilumatobacteraceae bacterium]